jgi:hypothetical protein
MRYSDPAKQEKADKKESAGKSTEDSWEECKKEMLTSPKNLITWTNKTLSRNYYQRLIVDYYFGELNTYAKLLYLQIMSQPRRFG